MQNGPMASGAHWLDKGHLRQGTRRLGRPTAGQPGIGFGCARHASVGNLRWPAARAGPVPLRQDLMSAGFDHSGLCRVAAWLGEWSQTGCLSRALPVTTPERCLR